MFVRAYLRASTKEQDATRARVALEQFASSNGLTIAATYIENASGAKDWAARPELRRLLNDCKPGDILLVEQVDRLSRLNADDWEALKAEIRDLKVKVVALDLPTSHQFTKVNGDETTARIFDSINSMMLDMLAAMARKDYEDRRRRQDEGIAKAKAEGRYKGRPENTERNERIMRMFREGKTWSQIEKDTGASKSTLSRLRKKAMEGSG